MIRADSYDEVRDYLVRYATDDWLMLSTVVDLAEGVAGDRASVGDVAGVAMRLATDLADSGCPPGDLMDDDRDFVPWPGGRSDRLDRLNTELQAFVERGELPQIGDVCWFHKVDG